MKVLKLCAKKKQYIVAISANFPTACILFANGLHLITVTFATNQQCGYSTVTLANEYCCVLIATKNNMACTEKSINRQEFSFIFFIMIVTKVFLYTGI